MIDWHRHLIFHKQIFERLHCVLAAGRPITSHASRTMRNGRNTAAGDTHRISCAVCFGRCSMSCLVRFRYLQGNRWKHQHANHHRQPSLWRAGWREKNARNEKCIDAIEMGNSRTWSTRITCGGAYAFMISFRLVLRFECDTDTHMGRWMLRDRSGAASQTQINIETQWSI